MRLSRNARFKCLAATKSWPCKLVWSWHSQLPSQPCSSACPKSRVLDSPVSSNTLTTFCSSLDRDLSGYISREDLTGLKRVGNCPEQAVLGIRTYFTRLRDEYGEDLGISKCSSLSSLSLLKAFTNQCFKQAQAVPQDCLTSLSPEQGTKLLIDAYSLTDQQSLSYSQLLAVNQLAGLNYHFSGQIFKELDLNKDLVLNQTMESTDEHTMSYGEITLFLNKLGCQHQYRAQPPAVSIPCTPKSEDGAELLIERLKQVLREPVGAVAGSVEDKLRWFGQQNGNRVECEGQNGNRHCVLSQFQERIAGGTQQILSLLLVVLILAIMSGGVVYSCCWPCRKNIDNIAQ